MTFDLLNFYSTSGVNAFKLCTKFEQNRIIHGRVIDDLARFRHAILWGGVELTEVCEPNFIKLGNDIGRSLLRCIFSESG